MILNCAIVDDEPLALELLRSYVEKTSFLRLVGRYSSAVQAMTEIPLHEEVHVLFLDIQMPELNGLEFSRMVSPETRIIFTTAFGQYALDSYKVNALDYLLKPISYVDFLQSVNKAVQWYELKQKADNGVDADEAPFEVDEGTARIALIDGGVRLDEVLVVVETEPVASECRNDAGRHRLSHVEGVADREDGCAHAQRGAVAHGDRGKPRRVDAQEREVGFGVGTDEPSGVGLAVGEGDLRV